MHLILSHKKECARQPALLETHTYGNFGYDYLWSGHAAPHGSNFFLRPKHHRQVWFIFFAVEWIKQQRCTWIESLYPFIQNIVRVLWLKNEEKKSWNWFWSFISDSHRHAECWFRCADHLLPLCIWNECVCDIYEKNQILNFLAGTHARTHTAWNSMSSIYAMECLWNTVNATNRIYAIFYISFLFEKKYVFDTLANGQSSKLNKWSSNLILYWIVLYAITYSDVDAIKLEKKANR